MEFLLKLSLKKYQVKLNNKLDLKGQIQLHQLKNILEILRNKNEEDEETELEKEINKIIKNEEEFKEVLNSRMGILDFLIYYNIKLDFLEFLKIVDVIKVFYK